MSIQEDVQNMPPIEVILKIILPKMNNRIKALNAAVQALSLWIDGTLLPMLPEIRQEIKTRTPRSQSSS